MEKYEITVIGSKVTRMQVIVTGLPQPSGQRKQAMLDVSVVDKPDVQFKVKFVIPAIWEANQSLLVNPWELNQALINNKVVGVEDRLITTVPKAPEYFQYYTTPIRLEKIHKDNTDIDPVSEEDTQTEKDKHQTNVAATEVADDVADAALDA